MLNNRSNLRNKVKTVVACLAVCMMFVACDKEETEKIQAIYYEYEVTSQYYEIWARHGRSTWKPLRCYDDEPDAIYWLNRNTGVRFYRVSGSGTSDNPFIGTWRNSVLGSITFGSSYSTMAGFTDYYTFTTTMTVAEWEDISFWNSAKQ